MLLSTSINIFENFGSAKEILKLLKETGFEAYDYSFFAKVKDDDHETILFSEENYIEKAKELRAYADSIGIKCNQAHAVFPSFYKNIEDKDLEKRRTDEIIKNIKIAGILGATLIVVHPVNEYRAEKNIEYYKSLEEIARAAHVKIGIENMWNWDRNQNKVCPAALSTDEDFKNTLRGLPSDVFCALVDVGHACMEGAGSTGPSMIRAVGDRLGGLHLHDNWCKYDEHMIPLTGGIDYKKIIEALADVNYQGDITLEVDRFPQRMDNWMIPEVAHFMLCAAKEIKRLLLNSRQK